MLRAFNRPSLLSQAVSVHSSQTPNGEEDQARPAAIEAVQSSLIAQLDEVNGDAGDGASSAATGQPHPLFYAGVMLRGQKADLVRLFELPPTERLNGDFHCAMRKRVLLQGRMYVFDHYVCFYSAVFGFAKKRRMPMRTIKAVRKKKHLGFPNSLEIETDEYKEFFTSFLSREEAFQLIMKLLPEAKHLAEGEDGSTQRRSTDTGGSYTGNAGGGPARDLSSPPRGGAAHEEGRRRAPANGGGGNARVVGVNGERSLLTRHSGSMADDNDDDEEDGSGVWTMEPRPAPTVSGARHVLHSTLPGTPREFFDVVLADSAPFFEDFLDSQGNRRINLTTWKRHSQLGHVRDMNFTAPIKGAFGNWGVSHTACYQSQRFCLYTAEHIVFESSQTMTDIPYGDCFTVDQRWDVRPDPQADPDLPQITFDLHVRVPFSSRCLFKGVIEGGSLKQVQETITQFVDQLRPILQERLLSRNTITMRAPGDPTLGPSAMTPRINSVLAASGRVMPGARTLQTKPSLRVQTTATRGPGLQSPGVCEAADQADLSLGQVPLSEPGVGRLLLSLGGRLAEGARSMLESGIDVVINLTQCKCTPQMRFLVAMMIIISLANLLCMLMYLWAGSGGGGTLAVVLSDGGPALVGLVDAGAAAGAATGGGGGDVGSVLEPGAVLGGAGGSAAYWVQRMAVLQEELQLLQGRIEMVSREVGLVVTQLSGVAAKASAGGGSAGGEL